MARYNCLLIDLDGTLLDFEAAQNAALEKTLQKFEIPTTPENFSLYDTVNKGVWALFEKGQISKQKLQSRRFELLLEKLGLTGDAVAMNACYCERLSECGPILLGADEFLAEIAEVATIAVTTNGVQRTQKGRIAASGLGGFFDEVFVSEKLGCQKPQRKFFDIALKTLGISNTQKVLVVGDSLAADICGGNAAQLDTCWFNIKNEENTTDIKPTYTVYGFEELKPIIYGEDGMPDAERKDRHRDGT